MICVLRIFLLFLGFYVTTASFNFHPILAHCKLRNESILQTECFYHGNSTLFTFVANFLKPQNNLKVQNYIIRENQPINFILFQARIKSFVEFNKKYRKYFDTGIGDFCALMKNTKSKLFVVKILVDGFKKTAPQFIHQCPYVGLHEARNFSFPRQYLQLIPEGKYMNIFTFYDGDEEISSGIVKALLY